MKTVALTVAVLALGLAACNKKPRTTPLKPTSRMRPMTDVNAASNDATANADVALNADVNASVDNGGFGERRDQPVSRRLLEHRRAAPTGRPLFCPR